MALTEMTVIAESAEKTTQVGWSAWGRGVVFAIAGSAVGVILWIAASAVFGSVPIINDYTDLFAISIGLFAAGGVIYGTNEARGYAAQGIALLVTLCALVVGQIIVVRIDVTQQLASEGFTDFEFVASLLDYLKWGLGTSLPALLAWIISATYAIALPRSRPTY